MVLYIFFYIQYCSYFLWFTHCSLLIVHVNDVSKPLVQYKFDRALEGICATNSLHRIGILMIFQQLSGKTMKWIIARLVKICNVHKVSFNNIALHERHLSESHGNLINCTYSVYVSNEQHKTVRQFFKHFNHRNFLNILISSISKISFYV